MVDGASASSNGMWSEITRRIVRTFRSMKTGLNELDYRSKPWLHKTFIATALIELIVLFFCALYVFVFTPYDRYSSFMWLMAFTGAAFLFYFACDSIVHENIVLIWVFNIGCLILTARMWYIFVSEIRYEGGIESHYLELAAIAVATVCQILFAGLSLPISEDFGRHIFFKVGARPHIVKLYKNLQIWIALLKLDVQSTMFMLIVSSFYFNMSQAGIAVSSLFFLLILFVSILTVAWAEEEAVRKLVCFGALSLIQPTLSTIALVNLNLSTKTDLKDDIRRHHEQSASNTTSIDMHFEAAMVVINSTVVVCIVTRLGMIIALYFVTKGFGKGLTQALTKQNDAATVRQSPQSLTHSEEAIGNEDVGQQDPEWAFVDQCSHIDSIHLADKEPIPSEDQVRQSTGGDQFYRPISQSSVEFTRLRTASMTGSAAASSPPIRLAMEIPIHTATVRLSGDPA